MKPPVPTGRAAESYISDVVDGLIRMMDSSVEGPLNLGSPKEYKLIDVAQQIIKMCNSFLTD